MTVFMGVPTENHPWRWAETVRSGVRGVRKGLAALDRAGVPTGSAGVALFAEWTTTPDEWAAFERDWISNGGGTTSRGSATAHTVQPPIPSIPASSLHRGHAGNR